MENIKLQFSDVKFKENGKLKLLIIVGTRPEIIRLSEVIKKCRKHFDCVLAHTGQNYDYNLNGIFFRDLGLAGPRFVIITTAEGETRQVLSQQFAGIVFLSPEQYLAQLEQEREKLDRI